MGCAATPSVLFLIIQGPLLPASPTSIQYYDMLGEKFLKLLKRDNYSLGNYNTHYPSTAGLVWTRPRNFEARGTGHLNFKLASRPARLEETPTSRGLLNIDNEIKTALKFLVSVECIVIGWLFKQKFHILLYMWSSVICYFTFFFLKNGDANSVRPHTFQVPTYGPTPY